MKTSHKLMDTMQANSPMKDFYFRSLSKGGYAAANYIKSCWNFSNGAKYFCKIPEYFEIRSLWERESNSRFDALQLSGGKISFENLCVCANNDQIIENC